MLEPEQETLYTLLAVRDAAGAGILHVHGCTLRIEELRYVDVAAKFIYPRPSGAHSVGRASGMQVLCHQRTGQLYTILMPIATYK